MIRTWQPGETVFFQFPKYKNDTATTAALQRHASTQIDTAAVTTSTKIGHNDTYPALTTDRPNDSPVGSFVGQFDTTGLAAGTYYITLPTTTVSLEGNSGTYTKKAWFYLGAGI